MSLEPWSYNDFLDGTAVSLGKLETPLILASHEIFAAVPH